MITSGPSPRTWSSSVGGGSGALRNGVEDEVRARDLERARRAVRPLDRQVGADHHERARRGAPLLVVDAVSVRYRALRVEIGQQRDADAQMVLERLVGVGRVDRDAVELDALALEVVEHLVVDVELIGADRTEVEWIEDQHSRATAQIRERSL